VHQEVYQEAAAYPDLEPLTQAVTPTSIATYPELEADLEQDPVPSFDVNLYPIPDMGEPPMAASELLSLLTPDFSGLGGGSPEVVAADPLEYDTTPAPRQPSSLASQSLTNALPEGPPIAIWSYVGPQASNVKETPGASSVAGGSELEFCHPRSGQPEVGMRAAGSVALPHPVALEARRIPAKESRLQVLAMEAAPVTSVKLEVPIDSDVLLQLLDQQMPQLDRLYALGQFAAHQSSGALALPPPQQVMSRGDAITMLMPAAAAGPVTDDYHLVSSTDMLPLYAAVMPVPGTLVSKTAISEIAIRPEAVTSAILPAAGSIHQMGMAVLQSLRSNLSRPAQAGFAHPAAGSMAFDLGTGVSSDVIYPRLGSVVAVLEARLFDRVLPLTFAKKRKAAGDVPQVEPIARLLSEAVEIQPVIPNSGLEPLDRKPPQDAIRERENARGSLTRPAWAHAAGFWHHAPRDLKLLLFAIPALLALVFHPGLPRIAFAAPKSSAGLTSGFTRAVSNEWTNVRTTLENRAAVALDEDFRSGLDNWASPEGSTTEWSFDQTGFVRPGPLALYRPSVSLTDYQVQFLGLIDKKALSWVVRAADFENFYVVKLAIVKSGPIPVIGLTRYAVINGKSLDRHDINIPLDARADTVYRVRTEVRGSDFTVEVQGQIADSWTETRLPRGGVGFFTASGEASRLRWMQIMHQYDMLGRLCAYLAPYDTTNGSWQP
jgi:hypothetical protein